MIEIATFLSGTPRRTLEQARRYLSERNKSGVLYNITNIPSPFVSADIHVIYSSETYDNHGPASKIVLGAAGGEDAITTYLAGAVRLVALLADQPSWLELMRKFNPALPEAETWATFGLNKTEIFRPDLRPMTSGDFVAPYHGGFVAFSVDTHGEVSMEAEAQHLALIVFYFAAMQAYRKDRVDEKFARFARPT